MRATLGTYPPLLSQSAVSQSQSGGTRFLPGGSSTVDSYAELERWLNACGQLVQCGSLQDFPLHGESATQPVRALRLGPGVAQEGHVRALIAEKQPTGAR